MTTPVNLTAIAIAIANLHGSTAPSDTPAVDLPDGDAAITIDLDALDNISNEKVLEALRQVSRPKDTLIAGHQNHNSHSDKSEMMDRPKPTVRV